MPKATEDGTNPGGVHYNGGVVYTSQKVQQFRCLKVSGDTNSETGNAWGTARSKDQAWKECIDAIDEHHSKKRKACLCLSGLHRNLKE